MLSSFAFPDPPTRAAKAAKKKARDDDPALNSLTDLVNRLGAQLEKLEGFGPTSEKDAPQEKYDSSSTLNKATTPMPQQQQQQQASVLDPFAMEVLESYERLLQQEPLLHRRESSKQHCCCCPATTPVTATPGTPWPSPQPCRDHPDHDDDPLQTTYTHWCTLMRCLPLMDPSAQTHVRVIGLYAMRQLLQSMETHRCSSTATFSSSTQKSTTRYTAPASMAASPRQTAHHGGGRYDSQVSHGRPPPPLTLAPISSSSALLKNSSSCLNIYAHTDATRKKADAWIPQLRERDQMSTTRTSPVPSSPPPPAPQPSSAPSVQHYHQYASLPSPAAATAANHHHRRGAPAKLRRWFFKRSNRVVPQTF